MKIGKPISKLPATVGPGRGLNRYSEIYQQLAALKDGEWLPIECTDRKEVLRIQSSMTSGRRAKTRTHGNIIYLTKYEG